jgi:cytochrome c-type biogenesis protein CcmH/NrfG
MASGTSTSAASTPPHLAGGCDIRKLPITPTEAFVLSRIDGQSRVLDLSHATGLPESLVIDALERLSALGAIVYSGGARAPTDPQGGPEPNQRDASQERPVAGSGSAGSGSATAARRRITYDPSLLDEEVEISLEQRKELLELFFAIEVYSHYELLGVPPDADRKAIKQAYFERVNVLHPDRFFGRNIGSYKARIDRVFTALTKAHDTLTKRQARADYDSYLESRKETVGIRSSRAPTPPSQPPGEAEQVIPAPARTPILIPDTITRERLTPTGLPLDRLTPDGLMPLGPTDERMSQELLGASTIPPPGRPPGATNDDARRQQMARKLKASASQPPPSIPPQGNEDPLESASRALEANLRARYETRLKDPTAPTRFLAMAAEAERAQSWASAVNALKTALELKPDDAKIQAELARIELLADRAYAGKFVEQARYEERDGQFERAARSYERAARGRGSADLYTHAALCQLRADGGGRRAVELARRAVTLAPTHVPSRLALARAYFQEGMTASAVAEATRALEVDPKNEEAKRMQAEFRKSG